MQREPQGFTVKASGKHNGARGSLSEVVLDERKRTGILCARTRRSALNGDNTGPFCR